MLTTTLRPLVKVFDSLAAIETGRSGFEPEYTAPKAAVLPLDDLPTFTGVDYSYFSIIDKSGQNITLVRPKPPDSSPEIYFSLLVMVYLSNQ